MKMENKPSAWTDRNGASFHVYIGQLDDPDFRWQGGDWNGNVPRRQFPVHPKNAHWSRQETYFELIRRIETGTYVGRQVDWSAWVARVSKDQIKDFVEELYAGYHHAHAAEFEALNNAVKNLESTKLYALVGCESPYEWAP